MGSLPVGMSLDLIGGFPQRGSGMGQILDIDARQCGREGMLQPLPTRAGDHFAEQGGVGERLSIHLFGRPGCAHDIVGGDAALLARKLVTARGPRVPLRMPWRTSACSTGSRCRGGSRWRVASALAATGRPRALSAMSMTAAMAKAPLCGRRGIDVPQARNGCQEWIRSLFPSRARRPKTPNSARCFIKSGDFANCGAYGRRHDQLGNPRPTRDRERLGAENPENHMHFTAIVGVERAG